MPQRESLKDMVELVAREDEGLFPRNVELRHLDVGHGITVDILAVRYGPAHAVVKDRENRFDRRAGIAFLFQQIEPVLDFRRRQFAQFISAKTGTNMPFDDAFIGIVRVGAEVDFYIFFQPFQKKGMTSTAGSASCSESSRAAMAWR